MTESPFILVRNKAEELAASVVEAAKTEYPHALQQELSSDSDLKAPRVLNPAFYGSYDWHSAVNCHWSMLRFLEMELSPSLRQLLVEVLDRHLTEANLTQELAFFSSPGGLTSERPYGWAWLLLLEAQCHRLGNAGLLEARKWSTLLGPLSQYLRVRLIEYFNGTLAFPIRAGTHRNSAFSIHVCRQAALINKDLEFIEHLDQATLRLFGSDTTVDWNEKLSGDAFLTPSLTQGALMADVLGPNDFEEWFVGVTTNGDPSWEVPNFTPNGDDPNTVHLEGILISRAWGLQAITKGLPTSNVSYSVALQARDKHLQAVHEINPVDGFSRSHWLTTFLVYLQGWLSDSLTA